MIKKWFAFGIATFVLTGAFSISTALAASTPRVIKQFDPVTIPFEQKQKKEIVDRLYKSWAKGIDTIKKFQGDEFKENEWKLVYGFDIDFHFTNNLSTTEAQSFFMALDEAKKAYKKGDFQYGILLNKDLNSAKIIWERTDGSIHVAELSKASEENQNQNTSSPNTPVWSLQFQKDFQ
ncbi:hypothetical protein [Paenibacillus eucommiae]|uniref:Uncharacterized protein n=1 Tax=Paenibacillus eucommiae TaxID=1355755 RepID=A0ABS4ITP7_9BACL|nr:hypothetical protein [Paenibacillus eucommiae]MBP1990490.1 hypothetical protein [Paenibacillus eucommiae]